MIIIPSQLTGTLSIVNWVERLVRNRLERDDEKGNNVEQYTLC